jgi:hypothetical protein
MGYTEPRHYSGPFSEGNLELWDFVRPDPPELVTSPPGKPSQVLWPPVTVTSPDMAQAGWFAHWAYTVSYLQIPLMRPALISTGILYRQLAGLTSWRM